MSELLGPVALGRKEEPIFIGKEIARHKDYSEETAQKIDQEINAIVQKCLDEATEILSAHKDKLELLAETLVTRETLDDLEIRELLGLPIKGDKKDEE